MSPSSGGRTRLSAGLFSRGVAFSATLLAVAAASGSAQRVQGRIVDANNGVPVGLAGVFVLDGNRNVVSTSAADTAGFYRVDTPGAGAFYIAVQRLGYFENETPLFAVEQGGSYAVDIEMRPEPFRLDPLRVTVRNEALVDYLTLELGVNPNSVLGFRQYQGSILERAKLKAEDNTDLLRELYVPVEHGIQGVCVGSIGMGLPERGSGQAGGPRLCGKLFLNDYSCPAEHIESIDMDRIAVVVVLSGSVRLYTRDFDFTFKPARAGGC